MQRIGISRNSGIRTKNIRGDESRSLWLITSAAGHWAIISLRTHNPHLTYYFIFVLFIYFILLSYSIFDTILFVVFIEYSVYLFITLFTHLVYLRLHFRRIVKSLRTNNPYFTYSQKLLYVTKRQKKT